MDRTTGLNQCRVRLNEFNGSIVQSLSFSIGTRVTGNFAGQQGLSLSSGGRGIGGCDASVEYKGHKSPATPQESPTKVSQIQGLGAGMRVIVLKGDNGTHPRKKCLVVIPLKRHPGKGALQRW